VYVVRDGQVLEGGTYKDLMDRKGHLAKIVGEHVITEKNVILNEIENAPRKNSIINSQSVGEISESSLTPQQVENRRRLSIRFQQPILTDDDLASKIETNQLRMTVHPIVKKNLSIVAKIEPDELVPEDADPLKLVLEDQSIFYKENPVYSYMKAGSGVVISILIVILFFFVHGIRIGSGE
jgi:hypothetical protein